MPTQKFSLVPRAERGLASNLNQNVLGEYEDSFSVFEEVILRNSAWESMPRPTAEGLAGMTGPIRNIHFFTRITDTVGARLSQLLYHDNTTIRVFGGGTVFASAGTEPVVFTTVKNRCFHTTPSPGRLNIWNGSVSVLAGKDAPATVLTYDAYGVSDAENKVSTGTVATVNGSQSVDRVSGDFFITGGAWNGKTIYIDGIEYTVLDVPTNVLLTLTEGHKGPTGTWLYRTHYGARSWSQPPKYGYGYYNPATGHLSNIGPVLTLTEQDMKNVNTKINNIVTLGVGEVNYTKIVFFRTAKEGAALLPLKAVSGAGSATVDADGFINANVTGPVTYVDSDADDSNLGVPLGPFEAPQTDNKPPPPLRYLEYWDGRLWGIESAFPWRVRFSGNSGQIPLGVPEECWPERNYRDIPTADGYGTGLAVVGGNLLVTTERHVYTVVGGNESNYRLIKISGRGKGVRHFGISEQPGTTTDETASVIYASNDKRVWRHNPGGKIEDIGWPIQDKLNAAVMSAPYPFFVKTGSVAQKTFAVVGVWTGTIYRFYFFDLDLNYWLDPDLTGMCASSGTDYASSSLERVLVGQNTALQSGLLEGTEGFLSLGTQFLDLKERHLKKNLHSIVLYTNQIAGFTVAAGYDGGSTSALTLYATSGTPRHTGLDAVTFIPQTIRQFSTIKLQIDAPQGGDLHRIDFFFSVIPDGSKGKP